MKINIIGISGSPRNGNTHILVKECLRGAEMVGEVKTEFIALRDYRIDGGCIPCDKCVKQPDPEKLCYGYKDDLNQILRKCMSGDGFIFGAPVYWGGLTVLFKMFIDRTRPFLYLGQIFKNKIAGAVTVGRARSGGQEHAVAEIIRQAMFHDMIPVGVGATWPIEGMASPWGICGQQGWPNSVSGQAEGNTEAVKQDKVALACAIVIGKRVAEMAKIVKAGVSLL
jgi:multimeric flavodoxin WrbA